MFTLAQHIQSQQYSQIRKVEKVGFDSESNCHVFPGFLYDKNGTRHESQEYGLFHEFSLSAPKVPKSYCFVQAVDDNASPEQIIKVFYQAHGIEGVYLLGAYISSIFATGFDAFPLIENTGSDAYKHLNRMFFLDFDGIKQMHQVDGYSQWLVPFEENSARAKLKEDELKTFYHRETPNQAALFFNRYFGEFSTPELLACSVTAGCSGFNMMKSYKPAELAVVGHTVMANRQHFECTVKDKTQLIQQQFIDKGIRGDVAFNHAVLTAGAELFIKILGLCFINVEDLYDYAYRLAARRTELLSSEQPLADKFLKMLFSKINIPDFSSMEKDEAELASYSTGVAIKRGTLLFTMPKILKNEAFKRVFSRGYIHKHPQLFNQLQQHPAYITKDHRLAIARPSLKEDKHQIRYWMFDMELLGVSELTTVTKKDG